MHGVGTYYSKFVPPRLKGERRSRKRQNARAPCLNDIPILTYFCRTTVFDDYFKFQTSTNQELRASPTTNFKLLSSKKMKLNLPLKELNTSPATGIISSCANKGCGNTSTKRCSSCKLVSYCVSYSTTFTYNHCVLCLKI